MMKLLDTLHRWVGGLIGLVLALLGVSGTILLYKHLWIGIPGAGDTQRLGAHGGAAMAGADVGGRADQRDGAGQGAGRHGEEG